MKKIYLSIVLLWSFIGISQNNPPTLETQPSLITLNSIPQTVDVNEFNLSINDIDGDNVSVSSSVNQYDCTNVAILQSSLRYGNSSSNTLGAGNVQTFKSIRNGFITKLEVEFRGSSTNTSQSVIEVYQNNNADPTQATDIELIGSVTLDIPAEYDALGEGYFENPIYLEKDRMYLFRKVSGPGIRMRQGSFYYAGRTFNHDFNNLLVINESGGFNNDWKFFVTQFDTDETSPISIDLTASDGNNETNSSVDVFHLSKIPPTVITNDITINLDASGNASITAQQIDNGSTAACGGNFSLSLDISNFDFNDLGDNVVTLSLTDENGNEASATAIVSVQDDLPPSITCPEDITTTATSPIVNFDNPTITDNVSSSFQYVSPGMTYIGSNGGKNFFISDQVFSGANAFADAVARGGFVATINDAAQNSFIASALSANGISEAHIGYSDAASEGNFVWQDGSTSTYENWLPGEPSNTDGGEDYVTINSGGSWNDVGARGTGNARYILQIDQTDGVLIQTSGLASGSSFPIGETSVEFEAYDSSGNSASCSFMVTVTDIPEVVTQNIEVILDETGNVSIAPEAIDKGSTAISGIASLSLDQNSFDCSDLVLPPASVSLNFEGDGHITIDGNAPLDFGGNKGFTFETQIYPRSNANSYVLSKTLGGASWPGKMTTIAYINSSNQLTFGINRFSSGGWTFISSPINSISLNQWQHVALSYDPSTSTMKIFVEGQEAASAALSTTNPDASPGLLRIGAAENGNGQFDGYMDDFRAWENALDPAEILEVKNNSMANVDNQLLLHYDFNSNSGTESIDLSSTERNGAFVGNLNESSWYSGVDNTNPDGVTVTLTVTSNSGDTATGTAIVNVSDTNAPLVVAENLSVELDANGEATITGSQIDNGSSDNCGIDNLALDITSFDCSSLGENTVTLTATDASGNEASATAVVTVVDNILPAVSTQDLTVELDANGEATITAAQIDNESADNCGIESLVLDITTFDCSNLGENTVTLTVIDASGNEASETATVTVVDNIAPTAIATDFSITTYDWSDGTYAFLPGYVDNGSSDNCGIDVLDLARDENSDGIADSGYADRINVTCADVGKTFDYLFRVTDNSGNQTVITRTLTVEDNTDPIALTQNITLQLDANGTVSISAAMIDNGSNDDCSLENLNIDVTTFDCSNLEENTVTLTVTDTSGNEASATATVTVVDNLAPTIVLQDVTVELNAEGTVSVEASAFDNGSFDNCGEVTFSSNLAEVLSCGSLGLNEVTVTVTDASGNESQNTALLTVEDNLSPSVVTQDLTVELDANGEAMITAAQIDNESTDNCGVESLVLDITTFDCSNLGENTVNLTVTDASGNEASATAVVTVVDVTGPVLTTQDITVNLDENGTVTILPVDVLSSVEDNCTDSQEITLALDQDTFTATGVYTVNLTSTDASGNSITETAEVTVDDTLSIDDVDSDAVVKLYPNPTSGDLFFEVSNIQLQKISIYDMNGRLVKTSSNLSLNVSELSSGVYFAKVEGQNGKTFKVLRFIKK